MDTELLNQSKKDMGKALGRIPASLYVLTSRHQHRKRGVMVSWVQQVAFEPPMVMLALQKGRPIIPLIQESRAFAICQIARDDKLCFKKFAGPSNDENPFEGIEAGRSLTGSPVVATCLSYLDCTLIRHIDFEADHDLYIGLVVEGKVLKPGEDATVHLRKDGFKY